jgi:hypothetical protein
MIVLSACNFVNGYDVNMLWMSSFHITFCGHRKHALHVRCVQRPQQSPLGTS